MFTKRNNPHLKKSPLKSKPLRLPGQSVDEEIQRIFDEELLPELAASVFIVVFAVWEWVRWYFRLPPNPFGITAVAVAMVGITVWRFARRRAGIRSLLLARDGERVVGDLLQALREKGYLILHDLIGKDFNVDHILVGPAGVFTLETKTISKPVGRNAKIDYDGESITVDGFTPDRDPVVQAKAQAKWVRDEVKELTGKVVKVRPVVLYPGWFISPQPRGAEVWVLTPEALEAFLANEDTVFKSEEIHFIANCLGRRVAAN